MENSKNLYDLFSSGCKICLDNNAVEYYTSKNEKKTLTYDQLLNTSNNVKNKLEKFINKTNGHNVCLYFYQNLYHCSFIIGILSISNFYSYIHPNTHEDEIFNILNENCPSFIITKKYFLSKLKTIIYKMKKSVEIDEFSFTEDKEDVFYIIKILKCYKIYKNYQSVAYCLRTSGSLGKPKNVYSTHSSIVSNLLDIKRVFKITSKDKIAGVSSLSFDLSVIEMFLSFACGGTYVALSNTCLLSTSLSSELLMKISKVTIIQCTPSFLKRYSTEVLQDKFFSKSSSLRLLAMGGEVFPQLKTLTTWFKNIITDKSVELNIVNLYGLTEVSCWAAYHCFNLKSLNLLTEEVIPIGIPFSDTYLELSNEKGCLALVYTQNDNIKLILYQSLLTSVIKLQGLLRVGSIFRTNYIEPALDKSNQLDKLFNFPEVTLVETGDLVSMEVIIDDNSEFCTSDRLTEVNIKKENLHIVFLGRSDNQIKRNGKRVNKCYIESKILQTSCVDSVFVTLIVKSSSEKNLVAFCVASKSFKDLSTNVLSEKVSKFLYSKLSKVFIPSEILFTDSLPLTVNGKVCKNTLIKNYENIRVKNIHITNSFVPYTDFKALLSTFWKEVLNKSSDYKFDEDKFSYHGGDSISALRVLNSLNDCIPNFSNKAPHFLDLLFTKSFSSIVEELKYIFLEEKHNLNKSLKRKAIDNTTTLHPKAGKTCFVLDTLSHKHGKVCSKGIEAFCGSLSLKTKLKCSFNASILFDTNKCVDASPLVVCNKENTNVFIG